MMYQMIILAQPEIDLSIDKGVSNAQILLAVLLTLVLFWMTITGIFKNRNQGDLTGSATGVGVILIWMVPAAIGVSGLGLAYGGAILDAVTRFFS